MRCREKSGNFVTPAIQKGPIGGNYTDSPAYDRGSQVISGSRFQGKSSNGNARAKRAFLFSHDVLQAIPVT